MERNEKQRIKYMKEIYKAGNKYLKVMDTNYYTKDSSDDMSFYMKCSKNNKCIYIKTKERYLFEIRERIVETLKDINYKRGKQEWNSSSVIGLLHEVMNAYSNYYTEDNLNKLLKNISNRYNVPANRLTNQVATFLNNMERSGDRYDIQYYFSDYDLFMWKYRTPERLNKAVEENKLTDKEKEILKEIYDI